MNPIKKIKNKRQVARYGVVGIINTAIDFCLLFTLRGIGFPVELANILSTGTAFAASFVLNKKFAFKTKNTNLVREMSLFILVTLFGLWVLQTIVINLTLPVIHGVVHDQNIALLGAKLLATGVSMVWNYLFYSRVVFIHKPKKSSVDNHPQGE